MPPPSTLQVPRDRSMTRRDSASIARSQSPARVGLRDPKMIKKADKMAKKSTFQGISKQASPTPSPDLDSNPDPNPTPDQAEPPTPTLAPTPTPTLTPALTTHPHHSPLTTHLQP